MKLQSDDGVSNTQPGPSAEIVSEYLRKHLDFFEHNPDVLRDIELTHSSGDAVSLLERQVTVLRAENTRMKERFEQLVALATSNENLIKRIHQLALALMDAAGPEAIFATLTERLAREFDADHVCTVVLANSAFVDAKLVPEFVGAQWSNRNLFTDVLSAKMPTCGEITRDQLVSILPNAEQANSSATILPLSGKSWDGLLIIISNDETRFRDDMGTDFLAYLGDIVSLIVDPWVARDKSDC